MRDTFKVDFCGVNTFFKGLYEAAVFVVTISFYCGYPEFLRFKLLLEGMLGTSSSLLNFISMIFFSDFDCAKPLFCIWFSPLLLELPTISPLALESLLL
jgi:hypothetical protein